MYRGVSTVSTRTFRRIQISISAWRQKKGFLQKTCWYSRAQNGNLLWLDNCGSENSQRRKWVTQQSSIRRCGTRFGNAVVTILHVQNKNFSGDPEEPNEVPGADDETKSHLHWQFPRISQIVEIRFGQRMVGVFREMPLLSAKHSRICLLWRHHERRFGKPFHGLVIPFGALVEYHPISARDHQFGLEVLPGVFFGYAPNAGESGTETF